MNAPTLNAIPCPTECGSQARVTANGSGVLTVYCGKCKFQGFAKSPLAVESLKKRIGAPAGKPADDRPDGRTADKSADDDGDFLKKL